MKISRKQKVTLASLACLAILFGLWCVCVKRVTREHYCEHCLYEKIVEDYEFLSFSVLGGRERESETAIQRIAADLGAPCPHSDMVPYDVIRLHGLLFEQRMLPGYTYLYVDPEWYNDEYRAVIAEMRRENPELGVKFRIRVIYEHDKEYWIRFVTDLKNRAAERHSP